MTTPSPNKAEAAADVTFAKASNEEDHYTSPYDENPDGVGMEPEKHASAVMAD